MFLQIFLFFPFSHYKRIVGDEKKLSRSNIILPQEHSIPSNSHILLLETFQLLQRIVKCKYLSLCDESSVMLVPNNKTFTLHWCFSCFNRFYWSAFLFFALDNGLWQKRKHKTKHCSKLMKLLLWENVEAPLKTLMILAYV